MDPNPKVGRAALVHRCICHLRRGSLGNGLPNKRKPARDGLPLGNLGDPYPAPDIDLIDEYGKNLIPCEALHDIGEM